MKKSIFLFLIGIFVLGSFGFAGKGIGARNESVDNVAQKMISCVWFIVKK